MTNSTSNSTAIAPSPKDHSDLSAGQKAGIAIGVIAFLILVAVVGYFVYRYLKGRRKNRGEYRPQFEELHHAKDLPYLQPPAVEGLI